MSGLPGLNAFGLFTGCVSATKGSTLFLYFLFHLLYFSILPLFCILTYSLYSSTNPLSVVLIHRLRVSFATLFLIVLLLIPLLL